MKKTLISILLLLLITGCESTYYPRTISTKPTNSSVSSERNEFEALMVKDKLTRNQRSAEVVNHLINDDPADKVSGIILENTTNCNIIVRIYGSKNFTIPVPKNAKNFLIIDKGDYTFKSQFCNSKYNKQKSIIESQTITLIERYQKN